MAATSDWRKRLVFTHAARIAKFPDFVLYLVAALPKEFENFSCSLPKLQCRTSLAPMGPVSVHPLQSMGNKWRWTGEPLVVGTWGQGKPSCRITQPSVHLLAEMAGYKGNMVVYNKQGCCFSLSVWICHPHFSNLSQNMSSPFFFSYPRRIMAARGRPPNLKCMWKCPDSPAPRRPALQRRRGPHVRITHSQDSQNSRAVSYSPPRLFESKYL